MFIPYADLPDVSAAWEAYGKRCRANLATRMMGDISEESCRAAEQQWDKAHAESWAQYLADWQAAARFQSKG